jgi:type I restriction enzyme S subunit
MNSTGIGYIPVYGSGGVMRMANRAAYDKASVLIPRKGSIGNLFYVDKPFWTVDTAFYTKVFEDKIVPKFLYYVLQTKDIEKLNTAGGVPSLTQSVLNKIDIQLPTLNEQRKLVDILDKFNALVGDITQGLPAEIETRRKPYEYYRNKLLTFKDKKGA